MLWLRCLRHRSSLAALIFLGACGGASGTAPVRPSSPFTAADAALFDDGVDMIADPNALGGRWTAEWNQEFDARLQASDAVVIAEVITLRTDVDPERRTTYRLVIDVIDVVEGKVPARELTLSVRSGAAGYAGVERHKARLIGQRFVTALKWFEPAAGKVDAHFHMWIASDPVLARLRSITEEEVPTERRVIEHTN